MSDVPSSTAMNRLYRSRSSRRRRRRRERAHLDGSPGAQHDAGPPDRGEAVDGATDRDEQTDEDRQPGERGRAGRDVGDQIGLFGEPLVERRRARRRARRRRRTGAPSMPTNVTIRPDTDRGERLHPVPEAVRIADAHEPSLAAHRAPRPVVVLAGEREFDARRLGDAHRGGVREPAVARLHRTRGRIDAMPASTSRARTASQRSVATTPSSVCVSSGRRTCWITSCRRARSPRPARPRRDTPSDRIDDGDRIVAAR